MVPGCRKAVKGGPAIGLTWLCSSLPPSLVLLAPVRQLVCVRALRHQSKRDCTRVSGISITVGRLSTARSRLHPLQPHFRLTRSPVSYFVTFRHFYLASFVWFSMICVLILFIYCLWATFPISFCVFFLYIVFFDYFRSLFLTFFFSSLLFVQIRFFCVFFLYYFY